MILGVGAIVLGGAFLWALAANGRTVFLRLFGIFPLLAGFEVIVLQVTAETEFRMKRSVLRNSLDTLRELVDEYTADRGRPPRALAELVRSGYLRTVPVNPFTGVPDWRIIIESDDAGACAKFDVQPAGEEPHPPVDSITKATVLFGILGAVCLAGARVCARLQARMATSILVLGLKLVGSVCLLTSMLMAFVAWKGLARP